jgi:hypothetical protein
MKNVLYVLSLVFITSCGKEETKIEKKPTNYTVVLDLSDRILLPDQLDKDFYLIEKYFKTLKKIQDVIWF